MREQGPAGRIVRRAALATAFVVAAAGPEVYSRLQGGNGLQQSLSSTSSTEVFSSNVANAYGESSVRDVRYNRPESIEEGHEKENKSELSVIKQDTQKNSDRFVLSFWDKSMEQNGGNASKIVSVRAVIEEFRNAGSYIQAPSIRPVLLEETKGIENVNGVKKPTIRFEVVTPLKKDVSHNILIFSTNAEGEVTISRFEKIVI